MVNEPETVAGDSTRDETDLPIVGIGASAGGLEALREMLGAATGPTGMAFVVVQHLDPDHESLLAQLLSRETALTVNQVKGGETPAEDHVYIIPPGHGLRIEAGQLRLVDFERPRGMRRPIDDFFESLAEETGSMAACVVLSGTGADGALGLRAIKEHGGIALAQEPTSARYDGMPLAAVGTGLVDFVREPSELIPTLLDYFARRRDERIGEGASVVAHNIDQLCSTIHEVIGHDFSGYKRSTLERRIERRMQVLGIETGEEYLARIRNDVDECDALFRDLLINVTRFFRDREHFEVLRECAIVPLVRKYAHSGEIRVWIPGCSSGEEAFSIAMMLADEADKQRARPDIQIFATDIDERMLNIARDGLYPPASLADMPDELREKFMVVEGDTVAVAPRILDMVRFSQHSLIKDAPFSKLDLVSCRNLLIYFGDRLQQLVIPLLHYSLMEGAFLFLGPSETIGRFDDLFEPIDQKARLFRRMEGRGTYPVELHSSAPPRARLDRALARRGHPSPATEQNSAVKRILERYSPAALVVDMHGDIDASYGRLSRYFEFPGVQGGRTSAASLARPGLREILLPLIRQTQAERSRVVARAVSVQSEFGRQTINVIADPLPDGQILLVFREVEAFKPGVDDDLTDMGPNDSQVQILEDELRIARHRLRSTVEELETVNEELKSSNEEMMSMNEELQSTNEELTTVNDELKSKVDQLTVANADLKNFFDSTQLAVVVLDHDLSVRSFTEAATAIFPLKDTDRGRGLDDMTARLDNDQYLDDARAVIAGHPSIERNMETDDGHCFLLRTMPYRSLDGSISGATLVFTDITAAKVLERELAAERERLALALKVSGIGVWEYYADDDVRVLDERAQKMFFLEPKERYPADEILDRIADKDRDRVRAGLAKAAGGFKDYAETFTVIGPDGEERVLRGLGRHAPEGDNAKVVGVNFDITAEAETVAMRELMLREMNHRVKNLFAIIGGMISLTARDIDDANELATTLRERIAALGRAHSLTNDTIEEQEETLGALIEATLAPYRDHRGVTIEGEPVDIRPSAVSGLALLLHEWATNSVKYGALGDKDGTLAIGWAPTKDGGLRLDWTEKSSRPRNSTESEGFGSTLVAVSAKQLGASVDQERDDGGFRLTLLLPPSCRIRPE
ncbi:chemotaxis protein CheB [Sphingomicrobium nitratireducens]|uniref:chemotaxis protein CheB n=1 Tax=Sphingomicrobium nitratireducens TaxID=2964666 RepID=UPI00223F0E63|nr:chemotaxis protein CheB [Sphingomicrobium nitratireducens]